MAGKVLGVSAVGVYTALALVSITATLISAAQDHDVPVSVDGIRCDSCGNECLQMCGSRNFRACCYNYIKKRSITWSAATGGGDQDMLNETHNQDGGDGENRKVGQVKVPLLIAGGKHLLKGHFPELVGVGVGGKGESGEEEMYPLTVREFVAGLVRNLNGFENKKARVVY